MASQRVVTEVPSSNPYYLHHTDNPGISLVTQILVGDNYNSWSRGMTIALSAKNKIEFADGSISKPEGTDLNLLNSWTRNNNIVVSWILNSISKEIAANVIYFDTAHEIWNDLKERFSQTNSLKIFQLKQEIVNLKQELSSVGEYFTKFKTIWEELNNFRPICGCGRCSCGGVKQTIAHPEMECAISFLMGLNESFTHIRGQILLMDPLPSISKIYSLISQEERQKSIGNSNYNVGNLKDMAFLARDYPQNYSYKNNNRTRNQKERSMCTYCNQLDHTKEKCFKLHGYPTRYK